MEKRRKQAIVIKCLFLAVVLGFVMMFVAVCVGRTPGSFR